MYGPWLCRPTARPWCFDRVEIQVGHGIPSSEMQCPECIKIQTPFRPPSHKLIGHIIITEDATKYLGVNLKATVSWRTHIESISKKPNSMPRILRRSRRSCGEDKKQKKLQLVCLNFEYCSFVWTQHKKCQIRKLEINQRTAAWYTTNRNRNTNSLPSILKLLQWESLDFRRSKIQLIQTDSIMCPYYMYKGVCRFICVVIASLALYSGFGCIFLYRL